MTLSQPPTLSVLMTVYNGAPYLEATLQSILAQTFQEFELVIVDDGSTDATPQLLQRYAALDPRICLLHNARNQGIGRATNGAIAHAQGRYLALNDADDLSSPDRFQQQVALLDAAPTVGIVSSRVRFIDATGQPLPRVDHSPLHPGVVRWALFFRCCVVHSCAMVRRSVYQALQGYDPTPGPGVDYDLWLRAGAMTAIVNLPSPLLTVRVHPNSTGRRYHQEQDAYALRAQQRAISAFLGRPIALEVVRALSHIDRVTTPHYAYQAAHVLHELYRTYLATVPLSATEVDQIHRHFNKQRLYLLLKACRVPQMAATVLGGNFNYLNRLANFMRY